MIPEATMPGLGNRRMKRGEKNKVSDGFIIQKERTNISVILIIIARLFIRVKWVKTG